MVRALPLSHKDIPISSTSLFGGDLGKVVAKSASASHNYKALGDCFVLSGLSRPRSSKGMKWQVSTLLPFHGRSQSGNWQGRSFQTHRGKKRRQVLKIKGADNQTGKPKQR